MEKTTTFPLRYTAFALSIVGLLITAPLSIYLEGWYLLPVIFGALAAVGTWDMVQRRHTVSRNYPILANFRYVLEAIASTESQNATFYPREQNLAMGGFCQAPK